MKEAAGEANMTVITIVLIGVVLLMGTLVVTTMMNNASDKASCTSEGGIWYKSDCYESSSCTVSDDGKVSDCTEKMTSESSEQTNP